MPRLPPVEKSPHARLRATLWPGVGYSVVTFAQSHSSSSATICASPVIVPWPISERAIRITTVSSGRITTHALISGEPSWARTTVAPNGIFRPSASPPPAAAVPTMKERRSNLAVLAIMAAPSSCLRGGVNGFAHLLERAAPADIRNALVDVGIAWLRLFAEQRRHRHDHARLAVAALRDFEIHPGLLNLGQDTASGQALDRRDLPALGGADGRHARADRRRLDADRAS